MPDVRSRLFIMKTGTARYIGITMNRRMPGFLVITLLAVKVKTVPVEDADALAGGRPLFLLEGHREAIN